MEVSGQLHVCAALKSPGYPLARSSGEPKESVWTLRESNPGIEPGLSCPYSVAIPAGVSGLSFRPIQWIIKQQVTSVFPRNELGGAYGKVTSSNICMLEAVCAL
jgi:hypothetical protein